MSAFAVMLASLGALVYSLGNSFDILTVVAMVQGVFLMVILAFYTMQSRSLKTADKRHQKDSILLANRLMALDASGDGIGIVNSMGCLTYANPALIAFHGEKDKTQDDVIGGRWEKIFGCDHEKEGLSRAVKDLYSEGYWRGESKIFNEAEDKEILIELSFSLLPDGGFIGTARDVTAQHQADQEKAELEKQFFQAQKMEAIGRLAGGVAHDFNNILAAMNGYAEFLVDDLEKESPQRGFAESILKAGMQARSLVDQMLAFSRRDDANIRSINLMAPVQESINMLQASLPKTIELKTNFEIMDAVVDANATQISQVIMNLGVNASDAMEDEQGVLEISVVTHHEEGLPDFIGRIEDWPEEKVEPLMRIEDINDTQTRLILGHAKKGQKYYCLSFKDDGSGMSRTVMEHIFEPFFTTKPVDKGTGLGLATVHGVIASHKGVMIIDSEIGEGTHFQLFFPALEGEEEVGFSEEIVINNEQGGQILLVEDQAEVRDMLVSMVERLGYDVSLAESGLEALDMIRNDPTRYDLVLTDQNMPKMSGIELVTQVNIDLPDLPFIVISGYSLEKLQALINEHPAIKAVLRKPAKKGDVAQAIAQVLSQSKASKAA